LGIRAQKHLVLETDRAVRIDVTKFSAVVGQHLAYEQASVAIRGVPFATQEREPLRLRGTKKTIDGILELGLSGHEVIQRATLLVVQVGRHRAAAELGPRVLVRDAPRA
jgi:hypothetical protein